jgi:hypothetical protein
MDSPSDRFLAIILLDRRIMMSIIPTKTVEFVEMETGISDETVNEGKIRGETDAEAGSPLRGRAHPAEGDRSRTRRWHRWKDRSARRR